MRDGAERGEVPYVWPRSLALPARPPLLVYLDLNQWIALAKALSGHAHGHQPSQAGPGWSVRVPVVMMVVVLAVGVRAAMAPA